MSHSKLKVHLPIVGPFIIFGSLPRHAPLAFVVCHKSVTDPSILHGESYVSSCGNGSRLASFAGLFIEFTLITLFVLSFATLGTQFGCSLLHMRLPCHHNILPLWCYFELWARLAVSFSAYVQHWLVNHGLHFWGCSIHRLSLIILCAWRASALPHPMFHVGHYYKLPLPS